MFQALRNGLNSRFSHRDKEPPPIHNQCASQISCSSMVTPCAIHVKIQL